MGISITSRIGRRWRRRSDESLMGTDPATRSPRRLSTVDSLALYTQGYADLSTATPSRGSATSWPAPLNAPRQATCRSSIERSERRLSSRERRRVAFARGRNTSGLRRHRHGADMMALFPYSRPCSGRFWMRAFIPPQGHVEPGLKRSVTSSERLPRLVCLMHELGHAMGLAHSVSQGVRHLALVAVTTYRMSHDDHVLRSRRNSAGRLFKSGSTVPEHRVRLSLRCRGRSGTVRTQSDA